MSVYKLGGAMEQFIRVLFVYSLAVIGVRITIRETKMMQAPAFRGSKPFIWSYIIICWLLLIFMSTAIL